MDAARADVVEVQRDGDGEHDAARLVAQAHEEAEVENRGEGIRPDLQRRQARHDSKLPRPPRASAFPKVARRVLERTARRAKRCRMASQNLLEVTDTNFKTEILGSKVPVLVDFWAAWCAPCRAIAPHVEALAKDYDGKVRVGKCDIDANPDFSAQYDIRSIPTLLVFKEGKVVGQVVGAVPKTKIEDLIKKAL